MAQPTATLAPTTKSYPRRYELCWPTRSTVPCGINVHNYPAGSRLVYRVANQKTAIAWCYPHNYPMGSRLASRATNQKIAIAWCDPLAGKEILCIQLSWIGHPIFKAILLFRCSIFFCWLAGRISCYVKVKPLPICNLASFFLSCFLDNELT